jgi:outer membrane protein TolC
MPAAAGPGDAAAWWTRFNDPVLVEIVEAAQGASPTLASALGRVERSRAERVAAGAALAPQVDAVDAYKRERAAPDAPRTGTRTQGLQASWEIDLFGALRAGRGGARARWL